MTCVYFYFVFLCLAHLSPSYYQMESFELTDEDYNKQVSDKHLEELSRTHCRKWRQLPSHLDMDDIVEHDLDQNPSDERKKRHDFFKEWKETQGSNATYKKLINALLTTGSRNDAEYLCQLLKGSASKPSQTTLTQAPKAAKELPNIQEGLYTHSSYIRN